MFWAGFELGAGLAAFGLTLALCAWIVGAAIDAIDAWSSRISDSELKRRAALARVGQWPPRPARPWSTYSEWIALTAGLLTIGSLTSLYRYLSR